MCTPLVEFSETLEPVDRARVFVAGPQLLGIRVGNSFVAFYNGLHRSFALIDQPREFFARGDDFATQPAGFSNPHPSS